MRSLFSLVGFVVVVFLGAGWYFNWYKLDWSTGVDGKTKVQFDVDTNKVTDDLKKGVQKGGELIDGLKTKPATVPPPDSNFVGPMPLADTSSAPKTAAGLPAPTGLKK